MSLSFSVKFLPKRKTLDDNELWYVVEYHDAQLAFHYFKVGQGVMTPDQLKKSISIKIQGQSKFEPLIFGSRIPAIVGWRVFIKETKDIVFLKLIGANLS